MRFFGPNPALMVVEPESLCWGTGRKAGARDGATWAQEFARLPALKAVVRDDGTGLGKGVRLDNARRRDAGLAEFDQTLDVFHTPIQMKKNRPGVLLTVLCAAADADRFSELILRETSAFGVRRYSTERRKLKRELVKVKTEFGEVTVKVGKLNGKVVQVAPEFESCKKLAEQTGVALKMIYEAACKGEVR